MATLDNKKIYFAEVSIEHFDNERKVWDIDGYWYDEDGVNEDYALDEGEMPNRATCIGYIADGGTSFHIDEPFMDIISKNWLENRHVLESVIDKAKSLKALAEQDKGKKISLNKAVSVFYRLLYNAIVDDSYGTFFKNGWVDGWTMEGILECIDKCTEEFRNNFEND